ncbi:acetyltransferase [Marixanthomonas ophiurae]|uniref:Acetyltransferase n=1 Tax=Marixanthomonas ophiurae TaxID=387659 RepID=A0A3E1Q782_9FLAO|nr:acetyltransferase [Marixanthomonas ophiurae]RFN57983.1 acetyltransferase [Marixanthomonas ophiurae]
MKDLILYGAGGHCYAAIELIKSTGEYNPVVIYDDAPKVQSIFGVPVKKFNSDPILSPLCITIGENSVRELIASKFKNFYPSFIHNSAVLTSSSVIGKGTLVHPNAVIDAGVEIGDFCIINNNSTISHNSIIGNFVHIAIQTAIAGGVQIGSGSLIGAGSVILPEVKIGLKSIIGAGSVITKDVPDNAIVYGNPGVIKGYNKNSNE